MIVKPRNVVKLWDRMVVTLVNAKKFEEVIWRRVGGGASFALPKRGIEVVALADNNELTCVECLGDGIKVNEPPRELKIRVGEGVF